MTIGGHSIVESSTIEVSKLMVLMLHNVTQANMTPVDDYIEGIPQFAILMNSNDNVCIYKKFGQLHCRLLLHRQLELYSLEQELNKLDAKDDETDEKRYRLQCVEHCQEWDPAQKNLLDKIVPKLTEYG